ncbi:MAG: UDP-N-acetylmuramate--L-alanine ligase [Flavobacteriaceae bacterium]|nr:UDP-N-acetylmuramate--L-alanine ligase [Flavobacteriaceae bacterium]
MNLNNIHNVYLIGIGGIGMSALAKYFKVNGKNVAGYDRVFSPIIQSLQETGIDVHFEDSIDLIPKYFFNKKETLVIYTPAIPKSQSEFIYFKENDFYLFKRAQILGLITANSFCFAVAGTHGKTTTSSILGHILHESGVNATSFLGGIAENYNSNFILGNDQVTVVEADEFDRSFLQLSPNIACITSMDADHLDVYGQHNELENSFREFAQKVTDQLFVCKGLQIDGLTYGIENNADYNVKNLRIKNGTYFFDVITPDDKIQDIELNLPGRHNVLNAVAALAMANFYGVSLDKIKSAIKSFKGVQRRFSYKIKTESLVLIDDYAHHPTEINAVINSVRELYPSKKVLGIFQPHLFSRTRDFANDFASSLSKFDEVILLDIYPARELPIEGITSDWLLEKVDNISKKLVSKKALIENILQSKAEIIVMIGAGDIGEMVENVKNQLLKR